MPIPGFSDSVLEIIQLRTSGMLVRDIAKRVGLSRYTVWWHLTRVYRKMGFRDVVDLTRWAVKYGFDEPLGPERSEERPYPSMPKRRGNERIRLGRVKAAGR